MMRWSRPRGAKSISDSTLRTASVTATTRTIAATTSAAMASPSAYPEAASTSPTSTASEPAKSVAKCHEFAYSAALCSARAVRSATVARDASTASTNSISAMPTPAACGPAASPPKRPIAVTAIQTAAPTSSNVSASAPRFWALPCP